MSILIKSSMKFQIRKFKYFLRESYIYQYLNDLYKIFIKDKNFKILSKKIQIQSLGNFNTNINIFDKDELHSLNNDIDYIQSFRYFIHSNPIFFIYSSNSNLIYNFLSTTLNCKTYICSENFISKYNENKNLKVVSKNIFFELIKI